jgi:predicted nucleic acid-binding protein
LDATLPPPAMKFLADVIDAQCNLSVITKMESLGYNFKNIQEQILMEAFITGSNILEINDDVVNGTIAIRKSKKIDLPDAIIAATAIVFTFKLITRNTKDFTNIPGLEVIDTNDL